MSALDPSLLLDHHITLDHWPPEEQDWETARAWFASMDTKVGPILLTQSLLWAMSENGEPWADDYVPTPSDLVVEMQSEDTPEGQYRLFLHAPEVKA